MKILLTGVTGYIAQRLLPVLLENGHEVICCVRDKNRFNKKKLIATTQIASMVLAFLLGLLVILDIITVWQMHV